MKVGKYIAERINRTKKDFRIDTFASGGPGGANQNSVNSGVRITDLITGLSSEGREFRDQKQNKKAAFNRLVDKMIDYYTKEELSKLIDESEPMRAVRSYKLTQNTVVDHRTKKKYNSKEILEGKLDRIIEDLIIEKQKDN